MFVLAGIAALFLGSAAAYHRFLDPQGGLLCPDFTGESLEQKNQNLCINSTFSTSLNNMRHEYMYLIKFGDSIFKKCVWVNTQTSQILINSKDYLEFGGKIKNNPQTKNRSGIRYSCFDNVTIKIMNNSNLW